MGGRLGRVRWGNVGRLAALLGATALAALWPSLRDDPPPPEREVLEERRVTVPRLYPPTSPTVKPEAGSKPEAEGKPRPKARPKRRERPRPRPAPSAPPGPVLPPPASPPQPAQPREGEFTPDPAP